jgi:hypothetical protein
MADTVTNSVVFNGRRKLVTRHLSRSDGTGETGVVKVDKSAYTGLNGKEPDSLVIEKIVYDVSGMEVLISVDHTTDINVARLQGWGKIDFRSAGGFQTAGAGDTGDILFSTNGHTAADTYDITLYFRKKD